jgi:hypothetical protein
MMTRLLRFYSEPARLVSAALISVAVFFAVASVRVGLWETGMPGPGLTSFLGALLLFPLGIIAYVSCPTITEDDSLHLVPLIGGAGLCVFAWLLPTLGFAVSMTALMLFLTSGLQQRSWWQGVITAVVISGVLVVLFYYVLLVPIMVWPGWS